jgi:hypothetical protein
MKLIKRITLSSTFDQNHYELLIYDNKKPQLFQVEDNDYWKCESLAHLEHMLEYDADIYNGAQEALDYVRKNRHIFLKYFK